MSDDPKAAFAAAMARFGPFEQRPAIAVAFSGGPDSSALLRLVRDWAAARQGSVCALIVDHGLRPESAAEAALALERAAALSVEAVATTIDWREEGGPPARGAQAKARARRASALRARCAERAILHLALGHHAGDQRETRAMRAARGDNPGVAGMAALREERSLRVLRPLLRVEPDALRDFLRRHGDPWIDDPSNHDLRFERARLRAARNAGETAEETSDGQTGAGETRHECAHDRESARDGATARRRLDRAVARWIADRAHMEGGFALDWPDCDDPALAATALRQIATALTGGDHPPKRRAAAGLARRLTAGRGAGPVLGLGLRFDRIAADPATPTRFMVRATRERPMRRANLGPRPIAPPSFAGETVEIGSIRCFEARRPYV